MNVEPTRDGVDRIFRRYSTPGSPGCALAVMKDGMIVYRQGYGRASLEHDLPILPSTVFNIGSMAKQFTAFAIALLEDEGKLSYDEDIRTYLPEMHDFGKTMTIRHLINHTSGLRDSFPELLALAEWRASDVTTTEDVYGLLKAQRELNFPPGEEFLYANSNYVLLAVICERVSGQSFAALCQNRIFDPLGMTNSFVNDFFMKVIPGRARGHYEDGEGGWITVPVTDSVVGPTNIYTTVEDLAKWDENSYSGAVGRMEILERMQQPGRLNDGTELDYAFGLMVGPAHRHRGWQVVEHGGEQGGYSSWMVRFPEVHLSIVVLFNLFLWEMREYAIKVADQFLVNGPTREAAPTGAQGPPEAVPIKLTADRLQEKTGLYFNATRGALRNVTYTKGRLQYDGLDLVPLQENRFFFEVEPETHIEFFPEARDAPPRMTTITPSGEYGYDRVVRVSPPERDLAGYEGRYYSPELDVYWTIVAEKDQLTVRRRKYVDSRLTPLFADAFRDDWTPLVGYPKAFLVRFERDEHQAVTGLRVWGDGVRNLAFTKP